MTTESPPYIVGAKRGANASPQTTYSPGRRVIRPVVEQSPAQLTVAPLTLVPSSPSAISFRSSSSTSGGSISPVPLSKRDRSPPYDESDSEFFVAKRRRVAAKTSTLPGYGDTEVATFQKWNLALVDKTSSLVLPPKFRYLLLRPPRFGKSTFLSQLRHTCDILARPPEQSEKTELSARHLCLHFQLDDPTHMEVGSITFDVEHAVSEALHSFLKQYRQHLGNVYNIMWHEPDALTQVIDVVRQRGLSLFVMVDDFDAPFRPVKPEVRKPSGTVASQAEIAEVMRDRLWAPLVAARDTIHKLIVSGSILPSAALCDELGLSVAPDFDMACGFTIEEAQQLSRRVLDREVPVRDLVRSSGQYSFSCSQPHPLLHPQRAITCIRQHQPRPVDLDLSDDDDDDDMPKHEDFVYFEKSRQDASFALLSNILNVLPETSHVPGAISISDVACLVSAGSVDVETEVDAPPVAFVGNDLSCPTWQALVGAGALTRCPNSPRTLRLSTVPGVLFVIHSCIDKAISDRFALCADFLTAWNAFSDGDPLLFTEMLQRILRELTKDSLGQPHEPGIRGVLELILHNDHVIRPEEQADYSFISDDLPSVLSIPGYFATEGELYHIQPVTLTLAGLWHGENPNAGTSIPTKEELATLYDTLLNEPEDTILRRSYRTTTMEIRSVASYMNSADETHFQLVAIGGAHVLYRGPKNSSANPGGEMEHPPDF
uniref:AAA-ATPase-like domain-containing protein n=1 Tax=Mycena chlorophos TaxID=658473 RepID=A0ABQ0M7J9_MYCCL|nr:predicted protein [Mycena chlorophos]